MEEELFITLSRPRPAPLIQLQFRDWLHEVMDAAELVAIAERIVACRDARDDKFLELSIRLSTLLVKFRSPKPAADAPASPAPALAPAPRARTMHPIVERLHHMGVQAPAVWLRDGPRALARPSPAFPRHRAAHGAEVVKT